MQPQHKKISPSVFNYCGHYCFPYSL